jgi:acetyl-CoA carboxylase carboxyl transferase subunit beta
MDGESPHELVAETAAAQDQALGRRAQVDSRGLWSKCPACEAVLYSTDLENNQNVCPKCGHHLRLRARARLDACSTRRPLRDRHRSLPMDPLKFKDSKRYVDRLVAANEDTGEADAMVVMQGAIKTVPVVVACFEFEFLGGSMGAVVGERFVRGVKAAIEQQAPFICITASGGARMQEGLFSLMQMAKTTAAVTQLAHHQLPFISLLTDPTMGGVSASFAFVGDVVIAEPGALIGFRRSARDRADGARDPARGLPARRVPAREGRHRHDRRPPRTARQTGLAAHPAATRPAV